MRKAFRLPLTPETLNKARTATKTGRWRKSERSRGWETAAILMLQNQAAGWRLPDPCYWSTQIYIPRRQTKADLDNLPKAIHDALRRAEITPDDRYLVTFKISFWAGEYLLIYVKNERLSTWQNIMTPSKSLIRRLVRSGS